MRVKKLMAGAAILLLIVVLLILYFINKGPLNVASANAVSIDAPALQEGFLRDSARSFRDYAGKVLEVSGEVSSITAGAAGAAVVLLKTEADGSFINCSLEKESTTIVPGSQVRIKGICSGMGQGDADLGIPGDVYLSRCVVLR